MVLPYAHNGFSSTSPKSCHYSDSKSLNITKELSYAWRSVPQHHQRAVQCAHTQPSISPKSCRIFPMRTLNITKELSMRVAPYPQHHQRAVFFLLSFPQHHQRAVNLSDPFPSTSPKSCLRRCESSLNITKELSNVEPYRPSTSPKSCLKKLSICPQHHQRAV